MNTQDNLKSSKMKMSFKMALKIFKVLFIIYTILYWIWIIIDDWIFIEKYWRTNWLEYIGIWTLYFIVFAIVLSIYYWGIIGIAILVYHKIIQPIRRKIG